MPWVYSLDELALIVGASVASLQGVTTFSSVSTDSRTLKPGDIFFALSGENFDGNEFVPNAFERGAAAAVTTRTSDAGPCIVVENPLASLQRFAAHHRARYTPLVLAITGSCGKTTSKDFIAAVLSTRMKVVKTQGNLNNEIGCPLSLLQIDDTTDAAVIEMGAASPGNIRELCMLAQPTEAAITLIAPSHLAGFGSVETIAATKAEIVENLPADGAFYVNVDNPWCVKAANGFTGTRIRYGSTGDVALKSCTFDKAGNMVLDVDPIGTLRIPLPCRALASNVLLAIAVGRRHGITHFEEALRAAAETRSRFRIRNIGALQVIDDTYNASPASMAAALEGLAERPGSGARIAALGDMLELGPQSEALHRDVGELVARLGIDRLFARGDHASGMIEAAQRSGVSHAEVIQDPKSMAEAIHGVCNSGDILLVKGSRGMRMERVIEALATLET